MTKLNPTIAFVEWWTALPEPVQQRWLADPKTPTAADAWSESRRRQEAADLSLAKAQLEGFKLSESAMKRTRQYINGEIGSVEFFMKPMTHTYQIDPRSEDLGGGWKLRLLENGEQVRVVNFEAGVCGYADAMDIAQAWLSSSKD